jgi:hypothetical protein
MFGIQDTGSDGQNKRWAFTKKLRFTYGMIFFYINKSLIMEKNSKINDPKKREEKDDNPTSQPDPETLGKTDPQENMKGPVSSLVKKVEENMEKNDEKDKEDEE